VKVFKNKDRRVYWTQYTGAKNMQKLKKLPLEEIEKLGYYDFMGYLEVPFFNIGGVGSINR
jgi:hypothetical protein